MSDPNPNPTLEATARAHSDIGHVKDCNEDRYLIDQALQLYIVADGMGGHAAGEVASAMAVEEVQRHVAENAVLVEHYVATGEGRERISQVLETAVRGAGRAIFEAALADPAKRGMGTTVSLLLLTPTRGFIAHVGDSRVYLMRQKEVFQLTEDHSLINELIKRGRLKPEDAKNAPYRNAVTRAVGVHADVQVDVLDFELAAGDHFLLCSDGLTEHLRDDDEILEVMAANSFDTLPQVFVQIANDRGGKDNITTLIVSIAEQGRATSEVALKLKILRQMPLFQHLSYVELSEVLNISEVVDLITDEVLFEQGDPGDALYLILDGRMLIRKGEVELARLGPGGHLGEMGIMDKSPRSAAAEALMKTRLIRVERRALFRLMRRDKEVAVKLLWCFVQVLNQRLRTTSADLHQARSDTFNLEDLLELEEVL